MTPLKRMLQNNFMGNDRYDFLLACIEREELMEDRSILFQREELIRETKELYAKEDLLGLILEGDLVTGNKERITEIPKIVLDLVEKILKIQKGDKVLDLYSEKLNFVAKAYEREPEAKYWAFEMPASYGVARARKELLGVDVVLEKRNVLEKGMPGDFDKVFCNTPFGTKFLEDGCFIAVDLDFSTLRSALCEWHYALEAMRNLKKEGRAVIMASNAAISGARSKKLREYFVEHGYLESIIQLPEKVYSSTMISTSLLVLSHGNESVNIVDATDFGKAELRVRSFREEEVEEILSLLGRRTESSLVVSKEEIQEKGYDLTPLKYRSLLSEMENAISLEEAGIQVKRGLQIKKADFEAQKAEEKTKYRYLTLGEFSEGFLDLEENYLKEILKEQQKYVVENNMLLLSKTASPFFRSALVEVPEGEEVLATGNMYMLKLEGEKILPGYLQAFFMSPQGRAAILASSGGGKLPILSVAELKKMQLPCPPRRVQERIAEEYLKKSHRMRRLKKEYAKLKEELATICERGE